MKTVAEIGSNRLKRVLVSDKRQDPSKLLTILKSDIERIFEDYLELDEEVVIRLSQENDIFKFIVEASAVRIKDFGIIPD